MSPGGASFVPSSPKTGTNLRHPRHPQSLNDSSPMVITLGQQYNIGEKPTVILYTYIIRHAGTPENS